MSEVDKPEDLAISERGKKLGVTQKLVDDSLRLLAANGGNMTWTIEQLGEQGFTTTYNQLRHWKQVSFPRRYIKLATELQRQLSENIAGELMESAQEANEAKREYVKAALAKVNSVPPEHLAKNALALSNAVASDIQMSQLLRDRPTEIVRIDVNATIGVLEKLGVVEKQDEAIDVEVVEETDEP